jgi:aryl-alcohol dehydrogenase-like predicted oxidoreductase
MKKRKLGNFEVSEIGAGCMSISANYGPPADMRQGIQTIRAAFDKGVTFFDTARFTGRTKRLSAKRSHRSATKSPSPASLVSRLMAQ